jgi:acetyl-CoA acetyltransferase
VRSDRHGRAQIVLSSDQDVLGSAGMSWLDYQTIVRRLMTRVRAEIERTISRELGTRLWVDACSQAPGGSGDLAKKMLEDFGWTQDKIDAYARELSMKAAQDLVNLLPEPER